uniref:G protein alpha subunit n=1 Tax=Romanomermis culicivorax TaxID=13658 RepID=A0A915J8I4_ROMCU
IYDVGGQRTERRKWIHCFSDVNSVIFITSLAEYNMVLEEDEKTNRMIESITLFKSLCHSRWFLNVPMILFLNMKDVFDEKISLFPITVAFKDYPGLSM